MANDRLYIKCQKCNKEVMIAKHYGMEWVSPQGIEYELDKFFEEHFICDGRDSYIITQECQEVRND